MAPVHSSDRRLIELDGLRGLAALSVVIYHYSARFPELFPAARHVGFAFTWGHDSVLLFLAISGFVISFSLDRARGVGDFAVRRFARLYPAYWVAMALTLTVVHLGGITALQVSPIATLANLSMLQSFAYLPGVDGVYWTLVLELAFYLCMMALSATGALRQMEQVLIVWLGLGWIAWAWPAMPSRLSILLVLDYIPFFAIGMLSYRVWSGARSWRAQMPVILAVLASVAVQGRIEAAVLALMLFALFPIMLAGRAPLLATRPLLWLGSISYALYLVHHNIGFVILLHADALGLPPIAGFAIAMATAFALATVLHHLVEQPVARAITRWWAARESARRAVAP